MNNNRLILGIGALASVVIIGVIVYYSVQEHTGNQMCLALKDAPNGDMKSLRVGSSDNKALIKTALFVAAKGKTVNETDQFTQMLVNQIQLTETVVNQTTNKDVDVQFDCGSLKLHYVTGKTGDHLDNAVLTFHVGDKKGTCKLEPNDGECSLFKETDTTKSHFSMDGGKDLTDKYSCKDDGGNMVAELYLHYFELEYVRNKDAKQNEFQTEASKCHLPAPTPAGNPHPSENDEEFGQSQ